jgi:hypothetical protein
MQVSNLDSPSWHLPPLVLWNASARTPWFVRAEPPARSVAPQDAGGGPSALPDLLLILRDDVGVMPPDRSRQPSQWGMQSRHNGHDPRATRVEHTQVRRTRFRRLWCKSRCPVGYRTAGFAPEPRDQCRHRGAREWEARIGFRSRGAVAHRRLQILIGKTMERAKGIEPLADGEEMRRFGSSGGCRYPGKYPLARPTPRSTAKRMDDLPVPPRCHPGAATVRSHRAPSQPRLSRRWFEP